MAISPRPSVLLNLAFGLAVATSVSRGVFELYASKQLGYLIQTLCWIGFLGMLLLRGARRRPQFGRLLFVVYAFGVVAFLSTALTDMLNRFPSAWFYTSVMAVFAASFFVVASLTFAGTRELWFEFWLGVAAVVLLAVAMLQQFSVDPLGLPGNDTSSLSGAVRPASLTGSYLHYPLAMSLFAVIFAQFYAHTRRARSGLLAAMCALGVLISYSRSGAMILTFSVLIFFFLAGSAKARVRYLIVAGYAGFLVLPFVWSSSYVTRILSALSVSGSGNTTRINRWVGGVQTWLDGFVLVGREAGVYTNVTKNLTSVHTGVVESGLVQQLLSYGLIGAVLFYALFLAPYRVLDKRLTVLRAGYLGAVLESVVYQSIEVFPYVITLCLFPLVADMLRGDPTEESARGQQAPRPNALRRRPSPLATATPGSAPRPDTVSPRATGAGS